MTNTVENLRAWFLTCPVISSILSFNMDYLGSNATECSIYSMPSSLRSSEDVCGNVSYEGKQQLNFELAILLPYGSDVRQNLDNLQIFSSVSDWMYLQNQEKNFPEISEGEVKSILPTLSPYVVSATPDSAIYKMQCALIYWRTE